MFLERYTSDHKLDFLIYSVGYPCDVDCILILQIRKLRLRLSNLLTVCTKSCESNINLMILRPAFPTSHIEL